MLHSKSEGPQATSTLSCCSMVLGWRAEIPLYRHVLRVTASSNENGSVMMLGRNLVPGNLPGIYKEHQSRHHTHEEARYSPGLGPGATIGTSASASCTSSEARLDSQWGSSLVLHATFQVGGPEADTHFGFWFRGSGVENINLTIPRWPLYAHEYPPMTLYPRVQSEPDPLPSLDTILKRRRVTYLAWVLVAHLWPLPRWFAGPLRPGPMSSGAPVLFSLLHSELWGQKQTPTLSFCSKGLGWRAEKPLYHHGHSIALCIPKPRYLHLQSKLYPLPYLDAILTGRRVSHLAWILVVQLRPLPRRLPRPLRPGPTTSGAPVSFPMLHSKSEGPQATSTLSCCSMVLGWRAEIPLYRHVLRVTASSNENGSIMMLGRNLVPGNLPGIYKEHPS